MFSILKQRTIALYHFVRARQKLVGSFCFLFFVFLAVYFVADVHVAQAQAAAAATTAATVEPGVFIHAVVSILLYVAQFFLKIAMFTLNFIIEVAGYNGFLSSSAVSIGWVMVRDITNMFFVIILLLVAFGTILGLEQYEWKKMLVKFFFAAILVNFSRVICGLIIDVGQVVMITFVNGVAATAGGNMINAFGLSDFNKLSADVKAQDSTDPSNIVVAAISAVVFSGLTMAIMLSFLFILVARMIVLWVLIILSPFAFVLSVIPQTQKYASQWWSEFGNHVVVGPALMFFLWLSFAVVGGGHINDEISGASQVPKAQQMNETDNGGIVSQMKWNSMASFAIAIGILLVGAKTAQSLGTQGGSAMSKATDFAKKTAMVASGASAAMWLGRKGAEGLKAGAKGAGKLAYMGTLENSVERVKNFGQRQLEGYRAFRVAGPRAVMETVEAKDEKGKVVYEKDANGKVVIDEKTGQAKAKMETRQKKYENGELMWQERTGPLSKIGSGYRKVLASQKMLEKVKEQKETREELIKSRAGVVPKYLMQKLEGPGIRDLERMEKGQLAAEKERSAAKTSEMEAIGRQQVLSSKRYKAGKWQNENPSVGAQIAQHKERAAATEEGIKSLFEAAKASYLETSAGKKVLNAKVAASLKIARDESHIKTTEGESRRKFMRKDPVGQAILQEKSKWDARGKRGESLTKTAEEKARAEFAKGSEGKQWLAEQKSGELQTKVYAGDIAALEAEAEKKVTDLQPDLVSQLNISEQAKKAAEDFIKTLKEKDLQGSFEKAAERMRDILKTKDKGEMAKKLKAAEEENPYIMAMTEGQRLKTSTDASSIRKKQAEQAAKNVAISKPKYGTTTASTALSDYSEGKMKEYRQLERSAAMRKATEVYVELMAQKDAHNNGEEGAAALDIDQEAELFAASSLLSEEAWQDDQHDYVTSMLQDLKDGKMNDKDGNITSDGKKWEVAAKNFGKLGWLGEKAKDGEIKDNNGKYNFEVDRNYDRRSAADLQNLAASGMDVDLVVAHKKIAQRKEENEIIVQEESIRIKDDALSKASKDKTVMGREPVADKINLARNQATDSAARLKLTGVEAANYINAAVKEATESAILAEKDIAQSIAERIKTVENDNTTDYWQLADDVLSKSNITGLSSAADMEARYAKSEDFMQDAVKSNRKNAVATGHEELGYNQDYDSGRGVYRFTTFAEGQAGMRAERVKQKRQQLVGTDQYHSNGTLAQKQGIIDDFNEGAISLSTGGVTKDIQLNSMPERSLKAGHYIHKNEDAQVITGKDGGRYAVVGGSAALEKFAEDGDTTQEQVQQHMLTRGVLAELMAGEIGYSMVGCKLYQHTSEAEAQQGIINLDIAGLQVKTVKELAGKLLERINNDPKYLAKSKYKNQQARVVKKLTQIMNSVYRTANDRNKKENKSADNKAAEEAIALGVIPG